MADELVRVRTASGIETNVAPSVAKSSSDLTVLRDVDPQPAYGKALRPTRSGGRRAKPKTTVKKAAASKPKPEVEADAPVESD